MSSLDVSAGGLGFGQAKVPWDNCLPPSNFVACRDEIEVPRSDTVRWPPRRKERVPVLPSTSNKSARTAKLHVWCLVVFCSTFDPPASQSTILLCYLVIPKKREGPISSTLQAKAKPALDFHHLKRQLTGIERVLKGSAISTDVP
jgi:hypothetical protein